MKKTEAQAPRKVVNLVLEAREKSADRTPSVRLVIGMDRERRIQKFEIEDLDQPDQVDDLEAALAESPERGGRREVKGD